MRPALRFAYFFALSLMRLITAMPSGLCIRLESIAASSLVLPIAALCARGTSTIHSAEVIYRGYENLIEKLTGIGGKISEIRN